MSRSGYFLVAFDLQTEEAASERVLSEDEVASIFGGEIDLRDESHVLRYEPLSLFARRQRIVGGQVRALLIAFLGGLGRAGHLVILLLKGDSTLNPREFAQLRRALVDYYSSLPL